MIDFYQGKWDGTSELPAPYTMKSKKKTIKWAKIFFKRPGIQTNTLNRMLDKEKQLRDAKGRQRTTQRTVESEGEYPIMEERLATWIRDTRNVGICVETYMLADEGKYIMDELHPGQHFGFSKGWRDGFFERKGFALRRTTNTSAKSANKMEVVEAITVFHLV